MVCEPFRCAFLISMHTTGADVHQTRYGLLLVREEQRGCPVDGCRIGARCGGRPRPGLPASADPDRPVPAAARRWLPRAGRSAPDHGGSESTGPTVAHLTIHRLSRFGTTMPTMSKATEKYDYCFDCVAASAWRCACTGGVHDPLARRSRAKVSMSQIRPAGSVIPHGKNNPVSTSEEHS